MRKRKFLPVSGEQVLAISETGKALIRAKGVFEMREHYGADYRIFFSFTGKKIILLLAGSDKKDQDKTITKAK